MASGIKQRKGIEGKTGRFSLKSKIRDVYRSPIGRDIIDKLLLQAGKSETLLLNPVVSRLSLAAVKRLVGNRIGPGFWNAVIDLLNSEQATCLTGPAGSSGSTGSAGSPGLSEPAAPTEQKGYAGSSGSTGAVRLAKSAVSTEFSVSTEPAGNVAPAGAVRLAVSAEPVGSAELAGKERKWWKESVFYQVYPRSFYDTNGDGIGDIPGITAKLDYLEELGVDALWLCPVYDSPQDDNGYDIRDYRAIDPVFGTMEDFDRLLAEVHRRGMRLIMDLVINHTSDEHEWFLQALEDPNSKYRRYYHFRAGDGANPPNNWESFFGGPAWKKIPSAASRKDESAPCAASCEEELTPNLASWAEKSTPNPASSKDESAPGAASRKDESAPCAVSRTDESATSDALRKEESASCAASRTDESAPCAVSQADDLARSVAPRKEESVPNPAPRADEWALCLFSKKQMDLNWDNPEMRRDVYETIRWWLEKGVDGFRLDVINLISKTPGLPDGDGFIGGLIGTRGIEHYFYGPNLHNYLQEMQEEAFAPYGAFTVGETPGIGIETGKLLTHGSRRELDMIFSFDHLEMPGKLRFDEYAYDAAFLKQHYTRWMEDYGAVCWTSLFYDNHDNPRMLSKIDPEGKHRDRLAKLLAIIQFTLRGTPFIYQGQELGAVNTAFGSISELRDVESLNLYEELAKSMPAGDALRKVLSGTRDHARVPMQWDASPYGGFSTAEPWIGPAASTGGYDAESQQRDGDSSVGFSTTEPRMEPAASTGGYDAESQRRDGDSVFSFYKRLVKLRRDNDALVYGEIEILKTEKHIFAYTRKIRSETFYIECNLSPDERKRPAVRPTGELIISNCPETPGEGGEGSTIQGYEACIIMPQRNPGILHRR